VNRFLLTVLACLATLPNTARSDDAEWPGTELGSTIGDGGVEFDDADFEGNALGRFAERWPDDLVIAPIPGRSPQFGWSLALGGGYFLEAKDEDADHAPSVLGGFGWYAENGSYAFGAGGNLHLLDDDLRVKFGAGYLDVRYRFYGVGDQNDLGGSADLLRLGFLPRLEETLRRARLYRRYRGHAAGVCARRKSVL
jgi:hypothetical protein